ncbi:MAG: hypothetical protein GXY48_09400 [Methanomicrobiales archaeon]|nr:hypothetical protein [Methanomicrobiales archaeon]
MIPSLKHPVFLTLALVICACIGGIPAQYPVYAVSSGPVLEIVNLTGDEEAFTGYPYQGTVAVHNAGDQTSGVKTVVLFLKNSDNGNNATISSVTVDPIKPGENTTLNFIGTISPDTIPGQYSLYGVLPESNNRVPDRAGALVRLASPVFVTFTSLPDQEVLEQDIVSIIRDLTNENRVKEGLHSLEWDEKLAEIAEQYAKKISGSRFLSHTDSSGNGPAERAEIAGYPTTKEIEGGVRIGIAENLAYIGTGNVIGAGFVDPTNASAIAGALIDGWMKSFGHRGNILDSGSDRFGVGIYYQGDYYYAVSEFW